MMARSLLLVFIWLSLCACRIEGGAHSAGNGNGNGTGAGGVNDGGSGGGGVSKICSSIEIRSVSDLARWRHCRIVVGHVAIVNLQLPLSDGGVDAASPYALDVVEISDYVVVFHVLGVTSLQQLLPQLRLVRGQALYRDRYALIVYENRDLVDMGLAALLRVQHGALHIESNPQLCYVHTVDWVALLGGDRSQQLLIMRNNRSPNHCPTCGPLQPTKHNDDDDDDELLTANLPHCWQQAMPQRPPHGCHEAVNGSCSACNANCLGECQQTGAKAKCDLCANFQLPDGKCVDMCPTGYYQLNKRDCVLASRCVSARLIPHAGQCVAQCPVHHKLVQHSCQLQCVGHQVVHSPDDWAALSNCTKLNGSLTIELYESQQPMIEELEHIFALLQEVSGYVRIHRSPQLVSLGFLRGLRTIGGEHLINGKYALYVVNNRHLENIWLAESNQTVNIRRGEVFFHLNPRLCDWKISQLNTSLGDRGNISAQHASPNSNGERMNCAKNGELHAEIEAVNSTAVRIKLQPLSFDDKQLLLGYVYYYRVATHNVTAYAGRHGCGNDAWRMDITRTENIRHVISGLMPYTRYAFTVRTLTMIVTHLQLEAYSKVYYFVTTPSKPGPVAKVYARTRSSSEIELHWWPPRHPNGHIQAYYITHEQVQVVTPLSTDSCAINNENTKDICKSKNARPGANKPANGDDGRQQCECADLISTLSGPSPIDEDFFSREQQMFDETLPNLIYTQNSAKKNTSEPAPATTEENKLTYDDLQKLQDDLENAALAAQDTGIADFPIIEPQKICSEVNATVQIRLEQHCELLEQIAGLRVDGNMHQYTITALKPETTYRIAVRACVKGLANGCGPTTVLYATTVNKNVGKLLKQLGQLFQ